MPIGLVSLLILLQFTKNQQLRRLLYLAVSLDFKAYTAYPFFLCTNGKHGTSRFCLISLKAVFLKDERGI